MFRIAWLAAVALVTTIPTAATTLTVAVFSSTSPWIDRTIHWWGRALARAAGIRLRTENLERLDPSKRYILVANHHSYLDIPCILASVPQPIRFMAKVSLFRIPLFGWAMSRAGFIPIDRKNRRTAVKSFDLAAERIRRGNTIVIFPEEGRTRTKELRPFQRGAFLLALKSEKTIVPIALDGTRAVFGVGARRVSPGIVTVRVGTPIETAGMSLKDRDRLAQDAKRQIEEMLFGAGGISDPRAPEPSAPSPHPPVPGS